MLCTERDIWSVIELVVGTAVSTRMLVKGERNRYQSDLPGSVP